MERAMSRVSVRVPEAPEPVIPEPTPKPTRKTKEEPDNG